MRQRPGTRPVFLSQGGPRTSVARKETTCAADLQHRPLTPPSPRLPVAASTYDHDLPIVSGPHDLAPDKWMTVECSEAVPNRGFKGVAEFVAARPAFDVHQGLALKTKELDHVPVAAASGLT
jgi:hypothetical protein